MRKAWLALLILITSLCPVLAQNALYLSDGDTSSVSVYSPDGQINDPLVLIDSDGYIIQSSDKSVTFTSPFGNINVAPETLMAVTGFNFESPSVYLLDGQITLDITNLATLTVYTTSASYTLSGEGEYIFVYTTEEDRAVNMSENEVAVYDALRRKDSTISPLHYSDLIANQLNMPLYPPAQVVEGSVSFNGLTLTYSFSEDGRGEVDFPTGYVTEADLDAFMASYVSQSGLSEPMGVIYTYPEDGHVDFYYADTYTADEIQAVVDDFSSFLINYLTELTSAKIVEGSVSFSGLTLTYAFSEDGTGEVDFPAGYVTKADLDAFMALYVSQAGIPDLINVTYSYTTDGHVDFSYPDTYTEDEIKAVVNSFTSFLLDYLAQITIPSAPLFIEGSASFRGLGLTYHFSVDGSGYVDFPAGYVTQADLDAFMALYVSQAGIPDLINVVYAYPEDGHVDFTYPDTYSTEELKMVVNDFTSFLLDYLASVFVPAAPSFIEGSTSVILLPPDPVESIEVTTTLEPAEFVEGTFSSYGIEMDYIFSTWGLGRADIPSIVTEADVDAFMASFVQHAGLEELLTVTYSYEEGEVYFTWKADYSSEEIAYVVSLFTSYLDSYLESLMVPSVPFFTSVTSLSEIEEIPAQIIPTEIEESDETVETAEPVEVEEEIPADVRVPEPPFLIEPWVLVTN